MQETEMDPAEKVRENRLRRMAQRQGLSLHKSPRRDPRAYDYGGWYIAKDRVIVAGGNPHAYAMSLDDVEAYLLDDER
jgi:hypothetical protein